MENTSTSELLKRTALVAALVMLPFATQAQVRTNASVQTANPMTPAEQMKIMQKCMAESGIAAGAFDPNRRAPSNADIGSRIANQQYIQMSQEQSDAIKTCMQAAISAQAPGDVSNQ